MRRASLVALRRGSMRRSSVRRASLVPASTSLDLPWDILDRLLIPILCCHAAAIILSGVLNLLGISDVSTLTLFAWFALSTGGSILFYHHLKVCYFSFYFCVILFVWLNLLLIIVSATNFSLFFPLSPSSTLVYLLSRFIFSLCSFSVTFDARQRWMVNAVEFSWFSLYNCCH